MFVGFWWDLVVGDSVENDFGFRSERGGSDAGRNSNGDDTGTVANRRADSGARGRCTWFGYRGRDGEES